MGFFIEETGKVIHGIKEYRFDGVRFLFKKGDDKTVISFSAFTPRDIPQSYNYIKDFLNTDYTYFGFLDVEAPEADPRGMYYLDEKLGNSYIDKINLVIQYLTSGQLEKEKTWLIGSSKAGVGALLLGLVHNYPNIVVMAPQCRIARYIRKRSKVIYEYLTKSQGLTYKDLNNSLLQRVKNCNQDIPWNIHILCGIDDRYHVFELDILSRCFWMKDINIFHKFIDGAHDRVAVEQYRNYFKDLIINS